jgi:hypothetical protein
MIHNLENSTADLINGIRNIRIVDTRLISKGIAVSLSCMVLFSLMFLFMPSIQLTTARILFPLRDYAWPSNTYLHVLKGDLVHPAHEPLVIHAAVGGKVPDKCVIYIKQDGRTRSHSMAKYGTKFKYRIENPQSDFLYYIKADDARTREYSATIIRRPVIKAMTAEIDYPEYTNLGSDKRSIDNLNIRAVRGSSIRFTGSVSKRIKEAVIMDEYDTAYKPDTLEDYGFTWKTTPQRNKVFRFMLKDQYGFGQKNPLLYRVWLEDDPLPSVRIQKPERNLKCVLGSEIPIEFEISDNFGIKEAGFAYSAAKEHRKTLHTFTSTSVKEKSITHTLRIAGTGFKEGERIVLWGEASHFNLSATRRRRSDKLIIEVISSDELLALIQKRKVTIKQRVESLVKSQNTILERLRSPEPEKILSSVNDQQRVFAGIQNTEYDLKRLLEDYNFNKRTKTGDFENIESIHSLVQKGRKAASQALSHWRDTSDEKKPDAAKAEQKAEEVSKTLQKALNRMQDWEVFENIIHMLQELIANQDKLCKETLIRAGIVPRMAFKDLSQNHKNMISELSERQKSLKKALEKIEFEIEEGIKSTGRSGRRKTLKHGLTFIHEKLMYKKMDTAVYEKGSAGTAEAA